MNRRAFMAASAAVLAAPAIAWAQATRVLKFIPQADLGSLDPVWTVNFVVRNHAYLVFDTLYGQTGPDAGFNAAPQMAAGHTVEDDGRVWTLWLRDGLRFHDGEPVLARDCMASIRRWGARDAFGQTLMQRTDELSAPDDRRVVFRLKRPFPRLADALGKSNGNTCAIMPERLALTDPFKQVTEMVGSGPFRFKADERVPGSFVAYERFPGYVPCSGGVPDATAGPKVAHFDRIEWHTIPDPATAAAALQSGEMDWWELATSDLLPSLQRNGKVAVKTMAAGRFAPLLRPNHLLPPFNNPAVRRALLGAIDQTSLMLAAVGADPSLRHVPCGFFSPNSPLASDAGMDALTGPRDDDEVNRRLQAAGYKGETVALMVAADYPTLKALCDVAADAMRRVGMTVDYQATDAATMTQRRVNRKPADQGGWNLYCVSAVESDILTPATHYALRGNGDQALPGWPTSPGIEALREQWLDAADLVEQKRLGSAIQRQASEEVPYYPLGFYHRPTAHRADLAGVLDDIPAFWNVRRT